MSNAKIDSIPNTLFKYVDAEGGLATLQDALVSVMFSKPSDLNDPFEFLPAISILSLRRHDLAKEFGYFASPFLSAKANELRTEIELNWFITSMSKADRNGRMWAQYGGDHAGIKITFNLSKLPLADQKRMMRPVDYSKKKRVNVSDFKHLQSEKAKGNRLKQVATQKGKDWEHEEEVRWFLRDDGPVKPVTKRIVRGRMRAFIPLPHSCIKRVTVGYRSPQSLVRTVLELRKMHKAKWEVARATLSLNSFQFDEELVTEG